MYKIFGLKYYYPSLSNKQSPLEKLGRNNFLLVFLLFLETTHKLVMGDLLLKYGYKYINAAPAFKSFNDGLSGNWGTNTVTNISHLNMKQFDDIL